MRTFLRTSMIPVALSAVVLAGCGRHSTPSTPAMSADLKADLDQVAGNGLDLASDQKSASFPLTEIAPKSSPAPTHSLRRAPGPKAVASKHPTVNAAPAPVVAENVDQPQTQVAQAPAPAPSPTVEQTPDPSAPAVPRPSPVDPNAGAGASGQEGAGRSPGAGNGSGIGAVLGGIFGVIIRGGVVDGDNCDPRSEGRVHRRPPYGGGGRFGIPENTPGRVMGPIY